MFADSDMIELESDDSFDEMLLEGCRARKLQTVANSSDSSSMKKKVTQLFSDDDDELSLTSVKAVDSSGLSPPPLGLLTDELSAAKLDSLGSSPEPKQSAELLSKQSKVSRKNDQRNRRASNDDSSDDEAYEKFLEKMKKDAKKTPRILSGSETFSDDDNNDSLGGFIVPDDESISEDSASGDDAAFYLKTTNLLNKKSLLPSAKVLPHRDVSLDQLLSDDDEEKELCDLILSDLSVTSDTNTSERSSSIYLHNSLLSEDDDVFKEPKLASAVKGKGAKAASFSDSDDSFNELVKEGLQMREICKGMAIGGPKDGETEAVLPSAYRKLKDTTNLNLSLFSLSDSGDDQMLVKEEIKTPAPKKKTTILPPVARASSHLYTPACIRKQKRPDEFLHPSKVHTEPRLRKPQSSFIASLSTHFDENKQRHPEANKYVTQFKKYKEELIEKLAVLYDESVFGGQLCNVKVTFNTRLLKTAGLCKYLTTKKSKSREAAVELSSKVCDSAERVRDTLIHEMCHAAVWIINGVEDGHGSYWQYWGRKAELVHKDLPPIRRCHSYDITTKFVYQCTKCKYQVGRHSKSLDTERKICGRCRGRFELLTRTANGLKAVSASTPNKFALFVKENYGSVRKETPSHKKAMQQLSQKFSGQLNI